MIVAAIGSALEHSEQASTSIIGSEEAITGGYTESAIKESMGVAQE